MDNNSRNFKINDEVIVTHWGGMYSGYEKWFEINNVPSIISALFDDTYDSTYTKEELNDEVGKIVWIAPFSHGCNELIYCIYYAKVNKVILISEFSYGKRCIEYSGYAYVSEKFDAVTSKQRPLVLDTICGLKGTLRVDYSLKYGAIPTNLIYFNDDIKVSYNNEFWNAIYFNALDKTVFLNNVSEEMEIDVDVFEKFMQNFSKIKPQL